MRDNGVLRAWVMVCAFCGVVAGCAPGWCQEASARRLALVPVVAPGASGPPVWNYLEDVQTGLARSFSGEVVSGERLVKALEGRWVLASDAGELSRLEAEVKRGVEAFYREGGGAAIVILDPIVSSAEVLLPQVSRDPARAALLLQAHLFLWWSYKQIGDEAALEVTMAQAAERFPAAVVNSVELPPYVAQAFNAARERQRSMGATISVQLEARSAEGCQILINGWPHGDSRSAGLAVRPGRTYYVTGSCGEAQLPPRRVVAERSHRVVLDMGLAGRWEREGGRLALRGEEGGGSVASLTELGLSAGRALGVSQVVLAEVKEEGSGAVLQLDRMVIGEGHRACSVRLPLRAELEPGDVDASVRALLACKPTPTALRFAGEDNVYRTPQEYVDYASSAEHRVLTWVVLGLGGGALVAAGSLEVVALGEEREVRSCVEASGCRGTREIEGLRTSLEDTLLIRNVMYGVSGGLVALSALIYFLEAPDPEDYLAPAAAGGWRPWASGEVMGLELGCYGGRCD